MSRSSLATEFTFRCEYDSAVFHRSNAEMPHGYVPPILAPEFLSQRHERNYLTEVKSSLA